MRVKLGARTCGNFSLFCELKVWLFLRASWPFGFVVLRHPQVWLVLTP